MESLTRRQRTIQIAMQLGVLSILTLITMAALTHIATMILFRRLVIGRPKSDQESTSGDLPPGVEEHRVPVSGVLNPRAALDEEEGVAPPLIQRAANKLLQLWSLAEDLPNSLREGLIRDSGVTREVYVKRYVYNDSPDGGRTLMLCNPSGQTVDSLSEKAIALSKAIGYDSLVMFDYRPTGRSCKGLVAPDARTMLEDSESVIQWLTTIVAIPMNKISVAGISLGGLQAMRLALHYPEIPRLILINTFSSFSCLLRMSASLLPGALRIGGTSSFLPDITKDLSNLKTEAVAVVSVEEDERIPIHCTEELLSGLREGGKIKRIIHIELKGSHSQPQVDHNSLEMIRDFFL